MSFQSSTRTGDKTSRAPPSRGGKALSSKHAKTIRTPHPPLAPNEEPPNLNGTANGIHGSKAKKIKVEDVMDEGQLTRLAVGTTVDTAKGASSVAGVRILWLFLNLASIPSFQPSGKTEKAAIAELRKGVIKVTPVENDHQPRSLIILTGLKTLFQKQLPNMPREYIARLVYDSNSRGLAIIKKGYKVVGGICYRPFPHRSFAEIVFFATASADQEKVCHPLNDPNIPF